MYGDPREMAEYSPSNEYLLRPFPRRPTPQSSSTTSHLHRHYCSSVDLYVRLCLRACFALRGTPRQVRQALWWLLSSAYIHYHYPRLHYFDDHLTKCPLAVVPYCQYSVLCKVSPLQHLNDGLRGSHFSHPRFHHPSVEYRLGLASPSPRSSAQASYIPTTFHLTHETSRQRVHWRQLPTLQ